MFERIKELREYEDNTQKETANALHVTRSTYAGWESGKDIIPLKRLNELANIYGVTLDYIVGLSENPQKREEKIEIQKEIVFDNIRMLRLKNHLSQEKFGQTIKLSQSSIHKYENKSLITTMPAIELAKNYHYSLENLIKKRK